MKHIFLFSVMLFSLLVVCNCKHDLGTSRVTESQGDEDGKGKNPVNNPEQIDNNEPEVPEIIPPKVIEPEIIPPEVIQPENGTQGGETKGNEDEENETQEGEDEEDDDEETEEGETEGGETHEEETPEIETPITETLDTALLQINELRTEYSLNTNSAEYIEFKVIKGGSMEGLYLYSVMNNAQDIFVYIFPEIDVEAGEYITLHLRTFDRLKSCDELRDDLTISGGYDSCSTARDLWVTENVKLLYKTGIVYIQNADSKIMDAVILNEKPFGTWNGNQTQYAQIAERLFNAGMWQAADGLKPAPSDAVNTSGVDTSIYKSVSRYEGRENTHSAKDWYITVAGFYTPGLPNK